MAVQPQEQMIGVTIDVSFVEATDVIEVSAWGFVAQIRRVETPKGITFSVLFPFPVIAVKEAELRKYIMFCEYLEYYLINLNGD